MPRTLINTHLMSYERSQPCSMWSDAVIGAVQYDDQTTILQFKGRTDYRWMCSYIKKPLAEVTEMLLKLETEAPD